MTNRSTGSAVRLPFILPVTVYSRCMDGRGVVMGRGGGEGSQVFCMLVCNWYLI